MADPFRETVSWTIRVVAALTVLLVIARRIWVLIRALAASLENAARRLYERAQ